MKIAFIDAKLNLKSGGGSNQLLHLMASKLSALGHHITVITLSPSINAYPDGLPYGVIAEGPITNRLQRKYGLALNKILRKYEDRFDIFHLWDSRFLLDGAVYKRCGGKIPIIAHLNSYSFCSRLDIINTECYKSCGIIAKVRHRPENLRRKLLLSPFRVLECCLEVLMLNQIDAFIAVSPAVAEIYLWQNIDEKKIFVIPPAVDYENLSSQKHSNTPQAAFNGQYNILYVGRLSAEKGVDVLISALPMLKFPFSLHIVGDGPQKLALEQYSKQLGLSNNITFHGWIPSEMVVDWYLSSQIFVHPARWPEPFGMTVLDAMTLGIPVVAADSGGPPWTLQGTGLTFKPDDSQDLAEKINQIQSNPSLAASLAHKAQKRAREFDYKKVLPRLISVYTKVIESTKTK